MKKLVFLVLVVAAVALLSRTYLVTDNQPGGRAQQPGKANTEPEPSAGRQDTRTFIASVAVEHVPEGTVYHVRPTRAGRLADRSALDIAWTQATAKGVPSRANLRQQFLCHPLSVIARAKPTWDLESWRPAVGGVRTMLAACNPG